MLTFWWNFHLLERASKNRMGRSMILIQKGQEKITKVYTGRSKRPSLLISIRWWMKRLKHSDVKNLFAVLNVCKIQYSRDMKTLLGDKRRNIMILAHQELKKARKYNRKKKTLLQPRILPKIKKTKTISHPPNEAKDELKNIPKIRISKGFTDSCLLPLVSHPIWWRIYLLLITLCHKDSGSRGRHRNHLVTERDILGNQILWDSTFLFSWTTYPIYWWSFFSYQPSPKKTPHYSLNFVYHTHWSPARGNVIKRNTRQASSDNHNPSPLLEYCRIFLYIKVWLFFQIC